MRVLSLGLLLLLGLTANAQLTKPGDFLPHQLGENFTPHHLLVDYYELIAEQSSRVQLETYGRTNEGRPLLLATVSTPENLARLEAIRENNLKNAGLLPGAPDPALNDIAIVWLSFSVHGNEAAGSEASMGVLYDLANPADSRSTAWLKNTVVLLDPSLNPDGYNRYTNWYRQNATLALDPYPGAREHNEPWPGGRVNHYLFDLNRDWAWQTQVESRQRMVKYKQWMPQIHADLHEQGYTSPYYFAPAAAPYHEYITDWQSDFQVEIGKNHAGYFDRAGWLYFTRERFDLLYPSYGDTWPTFNGAIGMTYEQGGHSRAGRAIDLPNGDTLTLYDRVAHHRTTALSTVEIASRESGRLTQNFRDYFKKATSAPQGEYLTYVIKGSTPRGKMRNLITLLDRNGISYSRAAGSYTGKLYDYQRAADDSKGSVEAGDLLISAFQPRSVLAQVLFDPNVYVEDSVTYDITGWSIPLAYGLDAYASKEKLSVKTEAFALPTYVDPLAGKDLANAYAYVVRWTDLSSARFLAALVAAGVNARTATTDFTFGKQSFAAGTIVITRADNRKKEDFTNVIRRLTQEHEVDLSILETGFSTTGGDLGSSNYQLVGKPKVAILGGERVSPNEFGQVWYYFEQDLQYPVSIFYPDDLGAVAAGDYDILVLPEGRYSLKGSEEVLSNWLRAGGTLIAIGDANASLSSLAGFSLKTKEQEEGKDAKKEDAEDERLLPYGGSERRFIAGFNPGAVVAVEMDTSYPLCFGLGEQYFSLKTGSDAYDYLEDGVNAGRIRKDPFISGFVGTKAKAALEETLVFGVEPIGRGQVIYLIDNPLYRGFWEEGKLLFANALFQVR
ncbi:M14 family metallopeptidase [Neolewinella lacunae]|uniref:Zinc carboxypeptidase n=1 Tax=Neolewinella lacunae TaxID=1517758 RepID=A0A923TBJ9_9BACT|nr:M14 family metallopeptidase [Neolewinella lacunae]MBC6992682.1 zinc carboxypeptidase [Neolewinella lacunae]MDN3633562.1 M14 family metallopeptidase [Neolewinella lacunae]